MTNSMNQVVQVADQLAGKSPWTWLIVLFLAWLFVSGFAVRYMVTKLQESNDRLLKAEGERSELMRALSKEKEDILREHNKSLNDIVKEVSQTQQSIAEVLKRIERYLEPKGHS